MSHLARRLLEQAPVEVAAYLTEKAAIRPSSAGAVGAITAGAGAGVWAHSYSSVPSSICWGLPPMCWARLRISTLSVRTSKHWRWMPTFAAPFIRASARAEPRPRPCSASSTVIENSAQGPRGVRRTKRTKPRASCSCPWRGRVVRGRWAVRTRRVPAGGQRNEHCCGARASARLLVRSGISLGTKSPDALPCIYAPRSPRVRGTFTADQFEFSTHAVDQSIIHCTGKGVRSRIVPFP